MVLGPYGPEVLLLTAADLERARSRVRDNPEEDLRPSVTDHLWSWFCARFGYPRGHKALREG